jgi:PEP-CTERM motif
MFRLRPYLTLGLFGLWLTTAPGECLADTYDVNILFNPGATAFYTGPLALDFTLTGNGNPTNTVTLSNFNFGSGSANPPAWYTTGANVSNLPNPGSTSPTGTGMSGNLSSTVQMQSTDPSFNEFTEGITGGDTVSSANTISFQMAFSTNVNQLFPASLDVRILEGWNSSNNSFSGYVPTTSLLDSTVFMFVNLQPSSSGQQVTTANSFDNNDSDEPYITFGATPLVSSAVPEPGTVTLVLLGMVGLGAYHWRKKPAKPLGNCAI